VAEHLHGLHARQIGCGDSAVAADVQRYDIGSMEVVVAGLVDIAVNQICPTRTITQLL
jgi:hypothetical protein